MIVITGAGGMIGSVVAWHLNTIVGRNDLVLVDRAASSGQYPNISKRRYSSYVCKDNLFDFLQGHKEISAVIHMGAISDTTESDFKKLLEDNTQYSQKLWVWCSENKVPFLYASSAATYGDGSQGYSDVSLDNLAPLNGYGRSKHLFDQWVIEQVAARQPSPPRWAGFKFFNVYGPNEYHKGRMASVAFHSFNQCVKTGQVELFKSHVPEYEDGMQMRDFIYVKDIADVVTHFLLNVMPSDIYNVGSGKARSFKDLATEVMRNSGKNPRITYIDMPDDLRNTYQYFTEADIRKLHAAGYTRKFHSIEEGIRDYVHNYLLREDPYC